MIDANMTEADSQPVDSARVRVIIEPDSLVQAGGRVFRVANVLDFESVIGLLRDNAYRGWLVVEAEQDPVVAPAYAYADKGYKHLRGLIDAPPGQSSRRAEQRRAAA